MYKQLTECMQHQRCELFSLHFLKNDTSLCREFSETNFLKFLFEKLHNYWRFIHIFISLVVNCLNTEKYFIHFFLIDIELSKSEKQ